MLIVRSFIEPVLVALKNIPSVRLTVFLCVGASSKAFTALFIDRLPMDRVTHYVFIGLQYLALGAFCVEVVRRLVVESQIGGPRNRRLRGRQ